MGSEEEEVSEDEEVEDDAGEEAEEEEDEGEAEDVDSEEEEMSEDEEAEENDAGEEAEEEEDEGEAEDVDSEEEGVSEDEEEVENDAGEEAEEEEDEVEAEDVDSEEEVSEDEEVVENDAGEEAEEEEDEGEAEDVDSEEEEVSEDEEEEENNAGEEAEEEEDEGEAEEGDNEEEELSEDEEAEENGAGEEAEEEEEEETVMRDEEETEVGGENEVGKVVEEDEEEDNNREVIQADERVNVEEEEKEVGRKVKENVEVEEDEGEDEADQLEEGEEDRQVRDEEQVEEEDDGEEVDQEQEQMEQYHIAEQFRDHVRRTEDENTQQNQEGVRREHETANEEHLESDNIHSDLTGSKDEFYNLNGTKNEESTERKEAEDKCEKLTSAKETAAESGTTREDVDHKSLEMEEEESTDDEEEEQPIDEEADGNDEDVKIYRKDDHHTDIFRTLTEFRDLSLLTDLTLNTEDGKSFHVHSPVLAAVSICIREKLRSNVDNERQEDTSVGVHRWSVLLGPEVDHVGLKAVVEFAYTGLISCLNKNSWHQIKTAAQTLGVSRVLDLCKEEEEKSTKTGGQKKEDAISAAEQMMISLQSIKQLWMDRVGCDVILNALGGSFHVHRVILAVCSDYFRGMFTSGMRESHQLCVTLPYLLASELEVLFDCSYSGALPLNWKCAFEITTTALQLQYQPVLSLCLNFLHQELNPHSCLDVASFAEAYGMVHLLEVADDFTLRQFQKVSCVSKFKDLPAKKLLKYLTSQSLCVASELVVFKAVVAWIQAKPKVRLKFAEQLMKTVNFPLMTFKEFNEVQSLNMWSDHSLTELYDAVFEDFCCSESKCRTYLPKKSLVLIGGDRISEDLASRSISRELWFGNSLRNHTGVKKDMEWRKLGEMPEAERFSHEVAVLKGQLYVFGGKKYYGISDTLNSVYRYDPLQDSWESLADMQERRCSFSVAVLDEKIYAIGGYCDPEYIQTVERYCPTANTWSLAWPLDMPLCGHVAKVLQGQIFVSGGRSSNRYLASMFRYHPETGRTYLANMARPRTQHCMEILDERLYVAGGITADDELSISDMLACEVYNPVADSWTAFARLPVPHVGAGGAVLEGKFYVLGGYSQEDYTDTVVVHRYDPTTERWENVGKMPGPNNDIRALVLCLPPHFRFI